MREEDIQVFLAAHLNSLEAAVNSFTWFAVPNGGKRSPATGARLKKQGVRAGVPDLVFCLAAGKALFIELKEEQKGRLQDTQKTFHSRLTALGYPVYTVYATDGPDAVQTVSEILRNHGVKA